MWKKRGFDLLLVVISVAVLAHVAFSQPQRRPNRGMRFWERSEVKENMGLTVEQQTALNDHFYESAKSHMATQSQIEIHELELRQLLESETANEESVLTKAREIGGLKSQQYQDRVVEKMAFKRILTPEQHSKLREWGWAQREARRNRPERSRRPRARNPEEEKRGGAVR